MEVGYSCRLCNLMFASPDERDVHERRGHVRGHLYRPMSATASPSTGRYRCSLCRAEFDSVVQRDIHVRGLHNTQPVQHSPSPPATFTCRLCRCVFPSRSLLHVHRVRAHRNQFGGGDLQERPWEDNQNPFTDFTDNNMVEELYNDNDVYILAPNQFLSQLKSIYNFPVNKQLRDSDIRNMLERVYTHPKQGKAFKFNLAAGVIMENREDGTLRYFKPSSNMTLLPEPISVRDGASLQRAIDALEEMDLNELIRNYRINSKYLVKFITNLELYAYNTSFPLGNNPSLLPDYVRNNHFILTAYENDLQSLTNYCMFLALSRFLHPDGRCFVRRTRDYYHEWNMYCQNNGITPINRDVSPMIEMSDIYLFEQCFKVKVNIFQLHADHTASSVYKSTSHFPRVMNLNVYENHVNLIIDLEKYAKAYGCIYCDTIVKSPFLLRRHQSTCNKKTALKFPGGFFKSPSTLFDRLERVGIKVPYQRRFFPFLVCYDFEAILQKIPFDENKKLKLTHRHIPVSCSVASNIPGYTEPKCIVHQDPTKLVENLFYLLDEIRSHAIPLIHAKWAKYIVQLQQKINRTLDALERENPQPLRDEDYDEVSSDDCSDNEADERRKREKWRAKLSREDPYCKQLIELEREFMKYMNQLIVLSFNGGRYDQCLMLRPLVKFLIEQEKSCSIYNDDSCDVDVNDHNVRSSPIRQYYGLSNQSEIFARKGLCLEEMGQARVIKRGNRYVSISNNFYNFLDVCQYLPPATSYDKFLRAYGIEVGKQYFCYEWLDDYEKLNEQLPPYPGEAWYSSLKDQDILANEYEQFIANGSKGEPPQTGQQKYDAIKEMWEEKGWKTMKDLLIYYNNADVFPFVQALNIMLNEYFRQGIDVFKIAMSIPGVSRFKMMQYARQNYTSFPLITEKDRDLFFLFKSQLCAGASLIITRLAQKGVTPIRAGSDKVVQSCIGLDANALYCAQQAQDMPSSSYVRRFKENDFKPVVNKRFYLMHVWLKYLSETTGCTFHTRSTWGSEVKVGPYFLDGFAFNDRGDKIAAEMYGCFYHGHINCEQNLACKNIDKYIRTIEREKYLKERNYRVISIWECEFKRIMRERADLQREYDNYMPRFYRMHPRSVTQECILKAIVDGNLYGFAVVNVRVPTHLRAHFDAFPPIFANHLVEKKHLSPIMTQHVDEQGINFNKGRRLLLTGMEAEEIMLSTKMIAWYIKHGIEVSDVTQVVEFVPNKPFKEFVSDIAARRLEGARNPDKKIIAEIYKLMGNAAFGITLQDKSRHTRTQFVHGLQQAAARVNSNRFKSLSIIDDELFEVESGYRTIEMNLPIYLGFEILQNAKIRILSFYYDFLLKYILPSDINCILSDTDSIYISLTSSSIKEAVMPHKKADFQQHLTGYCGEQRHPDPYLCRECCAEHSFRDGKFPNLFKVEWKGDVIIALCSKTYIAVDDVKKLKISAKGINHATLRANNPLEKFWNVLHSHKPESGVNKGFRSINGQVYTYSQEKSCLPFFYCKRYVHDDGIFTSCLDVVLRPVPKKYVCLQTDLLQLAPDYLAEFKVDEHVFSSIKQALTFYKQQAYDNQDSVALTTIKTTTDSFNLDRISASIPIEHHWRATISDILEKIISCRMNQYPHYYIILSTASGKVIVNADERDRWVGIGENYRTARWCPEAYLRGRNILGQLYVNMLRKYNDDQPLSVQH